MNAPDHQQNHHGYSILTLREIASWQFKELAGNTAPHVIAGIPSLQRGAVWNAGQVELLWDSIMRGFPVGALVISRKLETQKTRGGRYGSGWGDEVTHHLLDGQQRCNAIALAFLDPCGPDTQDSDIPAALWLDLAPKPPLSGSTRQFLFRVLTKAHPWGYQRNDDASRLGIAAIEDAMKEYGISQGDAVTRPQIRRVWPHASEVPLPFSWLLDAALKSNAENALWQHVMERCRRFSDRRWAMRAAEPILKHLDDNANPNLKRIGNSLLRLKNLRIVALEVPQDILDTASPQEEYEESSASDADARISNIEHLFQRLNSGGTELRGEELAFSMIKAYWPRIEDSFAAIRDINDKDQQPMPGSHLATLGARAALIGCDYNRNRLPAPLSISRIRNLSRSPEKKTLEQYLGIDIDQPDKGHFRKSDLHLNLRQIDDWLLYHPSKNSCGLPPVLRTGLARSAPDVFLLLLHFAQKARSDGLSKEQNDSLRKPILGLVTALHWFGDDRARAIEKLYEKRFCNGELSAHAFSGVLSECKALDQGRRGIFNLLPPSVLEDLIPAPSANVEELEKWGFWKLIVENSADRKERETHTWPFLYRLMKSRSLLLYAQRAFMCARFHDFDPSHADTWKESNRPWDYDHILPSATLYRQSKKGTFKVACDEWVNTIGNLRAWPLELNRSKGNCTDPISESEHANSFLLGMDESLAFAMKESEIANREKAAAFMCAARARMIRIYSEWFTTLDIEKLL